MRALTVVLAIVLPGAFLWAQSPPDTSQAVTYDDGVTWSWEEEVSPIDIIEFVKDLPANEWVEIDEKTARGLLEDIIERALSLMGLEKGNGGQFEWLLRQRFLYFVPEYEYWFPPFEQDPSKRVVKFPVKIMRVEDINSNFYEHYIKIQLGRFTDERIIGIAIGKKKPLFADFAIGVDQNKYLPGVVGNSPKKEEISISINKDEGCNIYRDYYNQSGSVFDYPGSGLILQFEKGNPEPVVNNIQNEPILDLTGVGNLFDLKPEYGWEVWDTGMLQTFRGLVNLCKLQLNLVDNGYELERYLWGDIFKYYHGVKYFGTDTEIVNVKMVEPESDEEVQFQFLLGNAYTSRMMYLFLSKNFAPDNYDWGIKKISLVIPEVINGKMGDIVKTWEFEKTEDGQSCSYWMYTFDNDGYLIDKQPVALFKSGNPHNLVGE